MNKNVGPFLAFTDNWFSKHQRLLLWLANAPIVKHWFRWILKIQKYDCPTNVRITEIFANRFSYGDRLFEKDGEWLLERTTDFRTHPKFGKRIYFAFRPLWWMVHAWDWALADRFIPAWSYGFSTLTAYPDGGDPAATAVDGNVLRSGLLNEAWGTIRAGAGNSHDALNQPNHFVEWEDAAAGHTNQWNQLVRSIFLFDTSSLGAGATISAATLSLFGTSKQDDHANTPNIDIYTSTPGSNTTLADSDFGQLGSTSQTGSPTTYASFSTSAYNNFVFNATGLGNISKTGISKFGARNANYDVANVAPTWGASGITKLAGNFAEAATKASPDPKLVVTTSNTAWTKNLSDSISISESFMKSPTRILIETFSLTEAFSIGKIYLKNLSDALSLSEFFSKTTGRNFSDNISLSESFSKMPTKSLTDTFSITDTISRAITRSFSEVITLIEKITDKCLNGLAAIWSHKYSGRGSSFSDKYSSRGSSYSDKYSSRGSSYSDKYPHPPC